MYEKNYVPVTPFYTRLLSTVKSQLRLRQTFYGISFFYKIVRESNLEIKNPFWSHFCKISTVCVRACVRAYVRVCVRACVRACV